MLFRNEKKDPEGTPPGDDLRVPLLPLRDIIVFPHMVVPLFVGRQKSIKALEEAVNSQRPILLAAQRDAKTNEPAEDDIIGWMSLMRHHGAPTRLRCVGDNGVGELAIGGESVEQVAEPDRADVYGDMPAQG